MAPWHAQRDDFFDKLRATRATPDLLVTNPSGTMLIVHSQLPAMQGRSAGASYSVLTMCTAGGGHTRKDLGSAVLDDTWQPGSVGLSLPWQRGTGFAPAIAGLALAFRLDDIPACHGHSPSSQALQPVTHRLFDDPLLSSVMTALWRDAEFHGASSAFFEHGISLVLHRLATLAGVEPAIAKPPAPGGRLAAVLDLIENRLDDDLHVETLARVVNLDPRSFTRAFKRELRITPFAYITQRRMEKARKLLRAGSAVTEVAAAVGYANPAKFAAAFKRCMGGTPSQYRQTAHPPLKP